MLPASVVPHGEDQDVQQPIDPKARSEPQSAGTSRPLRAPLPPEAPDEQVILSFHLYFWGCLFRLSTERTLALTTTLFLFYLAQMQKSRRR